MEHRLFLMTAVAITGKGKIVNMKIKVEDIGKGTLIDSNGKIYIGDGDIVHEDSLENVKVYKVSAYDEFDNVTEIETLD